MESSTKQSGLLLTSHDKNICHTVYASHVVDGKKHFADWYVQSLAMRIVHAKLES